MSKVIPKLRFKEFKEEWHVSKMSDMISFISGFAFDSTKMLSDGGKYQLIKMSNVYKSELQLDRSPSYWDKLDERVEKVLLRNGDVILTLTGTVGKRDYGYSVVIPEGNRFLLNQRLVCLRSKSELTDSGFINGITKTSNFLYHFFNESKGGTGNQSNVGVEDLRNIKVTFPSLPEQQKIASFLSAVDEKIQQLTRKKELLEQYKKGVMQQLFTSSELGLQGLKDDRINADENNPTIPKSYKSQFRQLRFKDANGKPYPKWEEKRLGDVVSITKGKGISKTDIVEGGELECIRYGELYTHYKERITTIFSRTNLDIENLVLSEYNDIIIPSSGETQIDIARAACVLKAGVALGSDLNILKTEQDGVFLSYYINHSLKFEIAKVAQGNSVVHLYPSQLEGLTISIPSKEEQQKIASFLSAIDIKIERVANQITQAQTFKKGLLQQMFV